MQNLKKHWMRLRYDDDDDDDDDDGEGDDDDDYDDNYFFNDPGGCCSQFSEISFIIHKVKGLKSLKCHKPLVSRLLGDQLTLE